MPGRVADIKRFSGTSGANGAQTVSATSATHRLKVLWVTAKYSGAPTQTGVTSTLNNAAGSAFDTLLNSQTANAQNSFWMPDGELILEPGDALDVVAPAGGGSLTSSVMIACEVLS